MCICHYIIVGSVVALGTLGIVANIAFKAARNGFRRLRNATIRSWNDPDGRLSIFADVWAYLTNPEARINVDPHLHHKDRIGGMSLREARLRGLVPVTVPTKDRHGPPNVWPY